MVAGLLGAVAIGFYLLSDRAPSLPTTTRVPEQRSDPVEKHTPGLAGAQGPAERISAKSLSGRTWAWQFEGIEPQTVRFLTDGTVMQTYFIESYVLRGEQQVVVSLKGEAIPAVLTFKGDGSGFEGVHFDGQRVIWGVKVEPAGHFPDARSALLGSEWTWERSGAAPVPFRFHSNNPAGIPISREHGRSDWKAG